MPASDRARANEKLDPNFHWRGLGVSRLEGLTDAVFAIVLALLFLRTEPPKNFGDLFEAMKSLLPFAAMFAIIAYVWFESWLYSRRYGLRDGWTMFLQLLLLFLLLYYAYPLKFLFTMLSVLCFGAIGDMTLQSMVEGADRVDSMRYLFVIYGVGYGSIFGVLMLLYWRALALRDPLGLDETEIFLTRSAILQCFVQAMFAMTSVVLAAFAIGLSFGGPGWVYVFIGPVMTLLGMRQGRRLRALTKHGG